MIKGSAVFKRVVLIRLVLALTAFHLETDSNAQLCNGSLGDPVVNITFSDNTNFPPPSGYIYTSSTCPNDGYYTITTYTSACFGDHWHTVTQDHTTGGGSFMLVNASYNPGDFFVATVTNLCPNTGYQFSAWLMNVLNTIGIMPNITFSIEAADGSILGQYQTGDIHITAQPVWKQYGMYFTTPATNAQITLRITNNAPGGNGNDLALDDITFRPCGPSITTEILGNADTVDICEDNTNSYTFAATVAAGFSQPLYQWQVSNDQGTTWHDIPGANTLSYNRLPTETGAYWYRLSVVEQVSATIPSCRVASNTVVINVHAYPVVSAGPDRISIAGTPVALQGSITGELPSFYWSPSSYLDNDSILTPAASPPTDFRYTLYGMTGYGCKRFDDVLVKIVSGIYVPNAFTPNNDGKNDHWRIPFLDPLFDASVNVYNRFGQLVYHVEGNTVDWDGTFNQIPQPSGAYVYYIKFKSQYPDMKGTLLLIR